MAEGMVEASEAATATAAAPPAAEAAPAPAPAPPAPDAAPSTTGLRRTTRARKPVSRNPPSPVKPAPKLEPKAKEETEADDEEPHDVFLGTLLPHQLAGVRWLETLYLNGLNGILADEMGLGKTVQTIGLLTQLWSRNAWGLQMIVAPLSTLANWEAEFARFAPTLPVLVYHAPKVDRRALQRTLNGKMRRRNHKERPVVLISYETVIAEAKVFRDLPLQFLVVDEGHRLKNMDCQLMKHLSGFHAEHRILLTGTPLQNDLKELWSLLHFVMPYLFDNVDDFLTWFNFEVEGSKLNKSRILSMQMTENLVTKIHKILAPFMLRRVKADVADMAIPPKKELVVMTPMTASQKALYMAILHNRKHLVDPTARVRGPGRGKGKRGQLAPIEPVKTALQRHMESLFESFSLPPPKPSAYSSNHSVMALRRACAHPYLFPHPDFPPHAPESWERSESVVRASGKTQVLDRLLRALLDDEAEQQHKILIFSQFTTMLDVLQEYLELRPAWGFVRLDGNVDHEDRRDRIAAFQHDPETKIFLISTRAGGLGINLTAADTVVLYDSDWNPQSDLQAMDRAHRFGQTRPVTVFRLLAAHSFEDRMYARAQAKRTLEKMVIGHGQFNSVGSAEGGEGGEEVGLDAAELAALLDEEDGHRILVVEDGEEVISDVDFQGLLAGRATYLSDEEREKFAVMQSEKAAKLAKEMEDAACAVREMKVEDEDEEEDDDGE
ncbi:hypothetical protein AMAG_17360 [Allomyces macrogynus ATCC 38327]|uniref:Uncharacterized protein n=1 Tax=Allomyces macrogynus (strain ATCC 38327) TaxID=578462 RepID=A0A0L0TEH8_ALLM3|nr:hypothetical protein AMAG_17360 [Allomyces macrogynus ATCC 38327]|eukprot:KNE73162.1 hypothetical protein AMAG_17360 [Allomyces macrogynus ATCC 38327]